MPIVGVLPGGLRAVVAACVRACALVCLPGLSLCGPPNNHTTPSTIYICVCVYVFCCLSRPSIVITRHSSQIDRYASPHVCMYVCWIRDHDLTTTAPGQLTRPQIQSRSARCGDTIRRERSPIRAHVHYRGCPLGSVPTHEYHGPRVTPASCVWLPACRRAR